MRQHKSHGAVTNRHSHPLIARISASVILFYRCRGAYEKTPIYYHICKNLMEFLTLFSGLLLCLVEAKD